MQPLLRAIYQWERQSIEYFDSFKIQGGQLALRALRAAGCALAFLFELILQGPSLHRRIAPGKEERVEVERPPRCLW